jgi:GTP-binding protein
MGKPNTGKSTLLNRLLGRSRALVSDVPGTTRDVIEGRFAFRGRTIVVLDTAGLRRKSRVTSPLEYYSTHRAISTVRESDVVLLVVDAAEGLAEQDKKIASIVVREGRGLVFVLNKWDLLGGDRDWERAAADHVQRLLPGLDFAPVVPVSARTGRNLNRLLETVTGVQAELNTRVGTGQLNHSLAEWTAEYPPSARYNVKIRYGTQVSTRPQRFVFFANKSRRLPVSYERYLAGRLRGAFGLGRIPVALEIRQKQG